MEILCREMEAQENDGSAMVQATVKYCNYLTPQASYVLY